MLYRGIIVTKCCIRVVYNKTEILKDSLEYLLWILRAFLKSKHAAWFIFLVCWWSRQDNVYWRDSHLKMSKFVGENIKLDIPYSPFFNVSTCRDERCPHYFSFLCFLLTLVYSIDTNINSCRPKSSWKA